MGWQRGAYWLATLGLMQSIGCSDAEVDANSSLAAAGSDAGSDSSGVNGAGSDTAAAADAARDPDAAAADDALDAASPDTSPDAGADSGPEAGPDAATDANQDSSADAATGADSASDAVTEACPGCLFSQPPPAGHPGAVGPYKLKPAEQIGYNTGILDGYKDMLVLRPEAAGVFPTVLFLPGKQLADGGGFPAKLGYPYRAWLEQIASHGYVVALIRVEKGLLDADHQRMASDAWSAYKVLTDKITMAHPDKVALVGHSMGAKVALLAAVKTLADDPGGTLPDPAAVLVYSVSNEPPPIGEFQNALGEVKKIPATAKTFFTFATGNNDETAPWNTQGKANAAALYDALATERKQLLVLHGTGKGDPNPPTTPELHDDHAAPLSISGKPGSAADFAMETSYLDALDWYGFWKWTVGALQWHWSGGDPKWAYGDQRLHGGNLPNGAGTLSHQLFAQKWTQLPAP